jgi:hypothetical protein
VSSFAGMDVDSGRGVEHSSGVDATLKSSGVSVSAATNGSETLDSNVLFVLEASVTEDSDA